MEPPPFRYRPLNCPKNIRILKLLETGAEGQLQCELREIELPGADDMYPKQLPPAYTCLSYAWGSADATETLICDGHALQITPNLAEALRMTLWKNPNEYVWADQICINQKDTAEKSEQVHKMTAIYGRAQTILAWLGPERPDTALAVSWIQRISALTRGLGNDVFDDYANSEERALVETKERLTYEQSEALGVPFSNKAAWEAFSEFFHSSWFERVWVVQEVLPAREASVVRGRHSVDWHDVKAAATWYHNKGGEIKKEVCGHESMVCGIWHTVSMNLPWRSRFGANCPTVQHLMGQKVRPTYRWALEDLLQTFRCREATDPRDKVFALVGICEFDRNMDDPLLKPDYEKSVLEAYRDCWRAFLKLQSDGLKPLDSILLTVPASQEPGWLSWVPDWRVAPWAPRDCMGKPLPSLEFKDGLDNKYVYVPPVPGRESELQVEGHIFGRVVHFSRHSHTAELIMDVRSERDQFRDVYRELFSTDEYKPLADAAESIETVWAMSLHAGELPKSLKEDASPSRFSAAVVNIIEALLSPTSNREEVEARGRKLSPYVQEFGLGNDWLPYLIDRYCGRRWCITDSGFAGIGYQDMQPGDMIAMLWGMQVACVLRPRGDPAENSYQFIGEAYCYGAEKIIQGLARDDSGRPLGENITLV